MLRFLDTDVCVAFLRGSSISVQDQLSRYPRSTIRLPAIVVAELFYGLQKSVGPRRHATALRQFIGSFQIAEFTQNAAAHYGRIRAMLESKGQPIGANDYLVAAIVMAEKGVLVTGNVKEFKKVPNLKLENWLTT
ncbi:MAG: type II toxin-antitoxin system VapC family toxin [Verrucomicrobia bacterium]|nr:type II toxin-antitoxin system VapC family toxin [Verrucomicrobiota bacterium]MBV8279654.1 type II toxin-antitoxin system VapC family toxin [Verrucomicrobiota bacterium]